jgi:hypothetical protein
MNLIGVLFQVSLMYYYFNSQRIGLKKETEKSHKLLEDVEELLQNNGSIAERMCRVPPLAVEWR